MNYEERIEVIKAWFLSDIAPRFTNPSGVDPKITAKDTIEGVNSALPSKLTPEMLSFILNKTTSEIVRTSKTRTLPIVRDFTTIVTTATAIYSEATGMGSTAPTHSSGASHSVAITAARIRAGEAISDTYLRGTMRDKLLSTTDITEKDLLPYEKSLAFAAYKQ